MKLRWYDRILVSVSGLILVALGVLVMLAAGGVLSLPEPFALNAWLGDGWQWMPLIFLAGLLLIAWGGRLFLRPLIRRGEAGGKYYTVSGGETGVVISVQAIDHLVRKCLETWPEILSAQVKIGGQEEAMHLTLRVTLRSNVRIPELLRDVRAEIKDYIEECSGVTVQSVRVIVEATKDAREAQKQELKLLPQKREESSPAPAPADFHNTEELPAVSEAPAAESAPEGVPDGPEAAPEPDYRPVLSAQESMPADALEAAPAEPEIDFGPIEPLPVTLSPGAFPFPAQEETPQAEAPAEQADPAEEAAPSEKNVKAGEEKLDA